MVEVVVMLRAAIINQGISADLGADSRLAGNLARSIILYYYQPGFFVLNLGSGSHILLDDILFID